MVQVVIDFLGGNHQLAIENNPARDATVPRNIRCRGVRRDCIIKYVETPISPKLRTNLHERQSSLPI